MRNKKAGDLRHPVTLLRPVHTINAKGRDITAWETVVAVYAGKRDVSGREFYAAQANHAADTVTFTLRWRHDLDASWRILFHGKPYEIVSINGLGDMRDYMELRCKLVQGEGGA